MSTCSAPVFRYFTPVWAYFTPVSAIFAVDMHVVAHRRLLASSCSIVFGLNRTFQRSSDKLTALACLIPALAHGQEDDSSETDLGLFHFEASVG